MDITAQDFEHLFDAAMEWDFATWEDQINRFDFNDMPKTGHIYWVEEYYNLILCREFLTKRGFTYTQSFDEATENWAFISNYDFHEARSSKMNCCNHIFIKQNCACHNCTGVQCDAAKNYTEDKPNLVGA